MDSALIIGNQRWAYDVEKTPVLCKILMIDNLTKELQCIEAYFEYEQITWSKHHSLLIMRKVKNLTDELQCIEEAPVGSECRLFASRPTIWARHTT